MWSGLLKPFGASFQTDLITIIFDSMTIDVANGNVTYKSVGAFPFDLRGIICPTVRLLEDFENAIEYINICMTPLGKREKVYISGYCRVDQPEECI